MFLEDVQKLKMMHWVSNASKTSKHLPGLAVDIIDTKVGYNIKYNSDMLFVETWSSYVKNIMHIGEEILFEQIQKIGGIHGIFKIQDINIFNTIYQ